MQIEKLMKYLDTNIMESERKTYNKLLVHIKKRHSRSFSHLVTTYNIDTKKFLFAQGPNLNDNYINRLQELIEYCQTIIENKINISTYNASIFYVGKTLDISTSDKISSILRHLYTFDQYYNEISVSKELKKSPLLILTMNTRKRLDLGLLQKHAFDYCSNHALIEDKVQPVHTDLSEVGNYKKNYILDKDASAGVKQEVVKEAILDYFKSNGELYYISAEAEQKISRDINALIETKSTSEGKSSSFSYFILEYLIPMIGLIITYLVFAYSIITGNEASIFIYPILIYSLFNIILYIYRVNMLSKSSKSYCFNYYLRYPKRLKMFLVMFLVTIVTSILYLFVYDGFIQILDVYSEWMSGLYDSKAIINVATLSIIGIGLLAMLFSYIQYKHKLSSLFFIVSLCYTIPVIFIRTNIFNFVVFRGKSMYFSAFAISLLLYVIIDSKKKFYHYLLLALFIADLLIMYFLDNEFYLRLFY